MVEIEEKGTRIIMEGKDFGWPRKELLPGTRPLYLLLDQRSGFPRRGKFEDLRRRIRTSAGGW